MDGQGLVYVADHGRYATCVRLSGNTLISGGYDNRLIWWDLENSRVIRTIDAHPANVLDVAADSGPVGRNVGLTTGMFLTDVFAGFEIWNGGTGLRVDEFSIEINP